MARYIPALRFDALTRFYDPVVALTTRERRFKRLLVEQVTLRGGQRVVDVGCGTATLAMLLKRSCPDATVVGIDGDESVLAIARTKLREARVDVELRHALAWSSGLEPATADHVTCSLVLVTAARTASLTAS